LKIDAFSATNLTDPSTRQKLGFRPDADCENPCCSAQKFRLSVEGSTFSKIIYGNVATAPIAVARKTRSSDCRSPEDFRRSLACDFVPSVTELIFTGPLERLPKEDSTAAEIVMTIVRSAGIVAGRRLSVVAAYVLDSKHPLLPNPCPLPGKPSPR